MPKVAANWRTATLLLALLATPAWADRVTLIDGRVLEGSVSDEGEQVTLETATGVVRFPRSQVASVERTPTLEAQYQERRARIAGDDAEGLFALAAWADQAGLDTQAEQLCRQVVELDENHAGARRALKNVLIDGHWQESATAVQTLAAQIDSALADKAVEASLQSLAEMDLPPEQQFHVRELLATLPLRRGQFARAAAEYAALAASAPPAQAARINAICQVLRDHPDGMYVLTETYPPEADLLGGAKKLSPGPASLSNPLAMAAALRDKAREFIAGGARLLEDGRAAEPSEPGAAREAYLHAMDKLDQADALVPEIARNYKVEVTRRQIGQFRRSTDAQAAQFDSELSLLGRQDISPQAYAEKVARMVRLLASIRDDLDAILRLAKPYDRDLIVEIQWAEGDRNRIDGMLATLKQEMHEDE